MQIIQGDDKFHSLFQWNRELAQKIYELVAQVYNQYPLNFPISLGEFDADIECSVVQGEKKDYRVIVEQIEKTTGFDFLSNVSLQIQSKIESRVDNQ